MSAAALLPQLREHKAAIIEMLSQSASGNPSPRPESLADVELLESEIRYWDNALLRWTRAECAFREHGHGSLRKLYENHIAWAHKTGAPFAPDVEMFAAILMALGFTVADSMVYGLIFKLDANTARGYRRSSVEGQ